MSGLLRQACGLERNGRSPNDAFGLDVHSVFQ